MFNSPHHVTTPAKALTLALEHNWRIVKVEFAPLSIRHLGFTRVYLLSRWMPNEDALLHLCV